MSVYPDTAVRRAMKICKIILRAMSGEITWLKAAQITGMSDRMMKRWKLRYQKYGYDGLFNRCRAEAFARKGAIWQGVPFIRITMECLWPPHKLQLSQACVRP